MKVTVKQQPEAFKPVTLEITLESRDELEAFASVCGYNTTATDAINFENVELRDIACSILGKIYDNIYKLSAK